MGLVDNRNGEEACLNRHESIARDITQTLESCALLAAGPFGFSIDAILVKFSGPYNPDGPPEALRARPEAFALGQFKQLGPPMLPLGWIYLPA